MFPFNQTSARVRSYLQLTKTGLCLSVACSAAFGSVLCRPVLDWSLIQMSAGVFCLACGAATGNSLQEIEIDRLYARTCRRPLVTGRLSVKEAQCVCCTLIVIGLLLLWVASAGYWPAMLGLLALVVYNGLYTPLKQHSSFALLPGGFAGALPPLIGWTAAGGAFFSSPSWLLFSLFFLWQIPHFFLVYFRHRRDYELVGRHSLTHQISEAGFYRIFLVWLVSLVIVIFAFPLLMPQLLQASALLFLSQACAFFAIGLIWLLMRKKHEGRRGVFIWFNICFFLTMILVMAVQIRG